MIKLLKTVFRTLVSSNAVAAVVVGESKKIILDQTYPALRCIFVDSQYYYKTISELINGNETETYVLQCQLVTTEKEANPFLHGPVEAALYISRSSLQCLS
jgi:hypothetical protein